MTSFVPQNVDNARVNLTNIVNGSSPIGVFDSGVGGLSIANALRDKLPHENLLYVADNQYAPYGTKPVESVMSRCKTIVDYFVSQSVKQIVVACNTATLTCIDDLRDTYSLPFVGVEPGIKPALSLSMTGKIGVLATQTTIQSERYQSLVQRFALNNQVYSQACNGLVEKIESGEFDTPETTALLSRYILPLVEKGVDCVVLGCTHYGFLTRQIEALLPAHVKLVNTSEAIAKQASVLIEQHRLHSQSSQLGSTTFVASQTDKHTRTLFNLLSCEDVKHVKELPAIDPRASSL